MAAGEKLKAVQFWNMVSEKLQDIVNNSAADINALALKMAKEGGPGELPLIDDPTSNNTRVSESSKDFIVAPSFEPPSEYEVQSGQQSAVNNRVAENTSHYMPELKVEPHHKLLGLEESNMSETNTCLSLPCSPIVVDSNSLEENGLISCSKENFPLLKTEKNISNTKKPKKKRTTSKRMSKKRLHEKAKSEGKSSCRGPNFRLKGCKRKNMILQEFSPQGTLESEEIDNVQEENSENKKHLVDIDVKNPSEIVLMQSDCSNVLKVLKSPLICEWCNKEFYNSSALTSHQWIHVKQYSCAECSARFSTKGSLIVHQRSHTGEKPFHCDQCDACFSTNSNLRRHSKTHTGEKPWICPQCGKCYTEKKSLKVHLRRHTGEKPYQCQICLKRFSQTGILQTHMALHLDQKAHLCDSCGKSFRQRSQLRLHKLRHEGVKKYSCKDCPADFLTKGDLERHNRVHTGERPFACELCGKTYTRQQSLNEHMNRHYGLKPYECKYCNRKFAEMSACYKHIKHHERIKNNRSGIQEISEFNNVPSDDGEILSFEVCPEGGQLQALEDSSDEAAEDSLGESDRMQQRPSPKTDVYVAQNDNLVHFTAAQPFLIKNM